jgi:hypothetical protein
MDCRKGNSEACKTDFWLLAKAHVMLAIRGSDRPGELPMGDGELLIDFEAALGLEIGPPFGGVK